MQLKFLLIVLWTNQSLIAKQTKLDLTGVNDDIGVARGFRAFSLSKQGVLLCIGLVTSLKKLINEVQSLYKVSIKHCTIEWCNGRRSKRGGEYQWTFGFREPTSAKRSSLHNSKSTKGTKNY